MKKSLNYDEMEFYEHVMRVSRRADFIIWRHFLFIKLPNKGCKINVFVLNLNQFVDKNKSYLLQAYVWLQKQEYMNKNLWYSMNHSDQPFISVDLSRMSVLPVRISHFHYVHCLQFTEHFASLIKTQYKSKHSCNRLPTHWGYSRAKFFASITSSCFSVFPSTF